MIPDWVDSACLNQVVRIDLGLEGAWSETVVCVWDPEHAFSGVPTDFPARRELRPALELYLPDGWIGIQCAMEVDAVYSVDVERVRRIAERVAEAVARTA